VTGSWQIRVMDTGRGTVTRAAALAVSLLSLVACGEGDPLLPPKIDAAIDAAVDTTIPADTQPNDVAGEAPGEAPGDHAGDDAGAAPFMAITPCLTPESYVTGAVAVATAGVSYSPACLRVPVGATVTIDASNVHPLEPRPLGTPGTPITARFAPTSLTFPAAGFYPYQCPEHVDEGMRGVIWVSAAP
jgi:plastocyanin